MGKFTRVSDTEGAYEGSRCSFRVLACPGTTGTWMVVPDTPDAVQPTFYAVPAAGVIGFEVRRGEPGGLLVGYAENLGSVAWPVEHYLIRQEG